MAKKKFYSLSRYKDNDGDMKSGYLCREGFDVPNDFGLDLAVYRATDATAATNWEQVKTWFVVDCDCGLAIGKGGTKKEAIEDAFEKYSKVDKDLYRKKVAEAKETYGPVPGRAIYYL